jgi:DNA-binding PadR family transcriptional regulator
MEDDGWVAARVVGQSGRPEKREYSVTEVGRTVLADWVATTTPRPGFRSEIAVKMRGASYGDRGALLANIVELVADHRTRLEHYELLADRDYPDPSRLVGRDLDTYLVLRGGILQETFWITWLTEYLEGFRGSLALAPQPSDVSPALAPQPSDDSPALAPQPPDDSPALAPQPSDDSPALAPQPPETT